MSEPWTRVAKRIDDSPHDLILELSCALVVGTPSYDADD